MSTAHDTKSAGNLGPSGDSERPSADGSASRSSSFVFTSTKVTRLLNANPSSGCALTPQQLQTHAIGAAHALPEHSTFRQSKEEYRPSPIRKVLILNDQIQFKPPGMRFQPRKRLSRASISLYLEALGQYSSGSAPRPSPRARSVCSPAHSDNSPILSPLSEPTSRHPAQTPPCAREPGSPSKPPATPINSKEQAESYFTYRSHRTPSPR